MGHVKASKSGTSGSTIQLKVNFFSIISRPQWVLYQYRVDYQPPMESHGLRAALLYPHDKVLGSARSFDGAILFLPIKLPNTETLLLSETKHGDKVHITVTLTNELPPTSPVCLQFYNILFRSPGDPLTVPQHRLTIWPGFATTILQYESSIMLCVDVSHKVLRSETVLEFMANLRRQCRDPKLFSDVCAKELIGLVVLTKYNNKTYRVDEIAWDHTPNNTFQRGETEVTFKEYVKRQYALEVTDNNQALLASHAHSRILLSHRSNR
ncbi:hypothetical protein NHX12_028902 [Muraenolepis orangiensis]|uniref:PAZ domain-containing protein n=1 Tax=Muraenolepis orangiensis TaxID=630683 RepID=A0A9Q0ECA0_9TELE|nr:hypothetical protein NHX12_028902 [Muraenolepis orangiensis]